MSPPRHEGENFHCDHAYDQDLGSGSNPKCSYMSINGLSKQRSSRTFHTSSGLEAGEVSEHRSKEVSKWDLLLCHGLFRLGWGRPQEKLDKSGLDEYVSQGSPKGRQQIGKHVKTISIVLGNQ